MINISNTATNKNVISKSRLFDEASILFALFIGYLIKSSTKLDVKDYPNIYIAYICIQLGGLAIIIGTLSIVLSYFITYSVEELFSIDINPDTKEQEDKQISLIYQFLDKLDIIQYLLQIISYFCLIIFITSYCLSLYSMYYLDLNFTIFIFIIVVSIIITILIIIIIYKLKNNTQKNIKSLKSEKDFKDLL